MKIKNPTFKFDGDRGYVPLDGKGRDLYGTKIKRRIRCHSSFKLEMQPREKKAEPRWFNLADKIN